MFWYDFGMVSLLLRYGVGVFLIPKLRCQLGKRKPQLWRIHVFVALDGKARVVVAIVGASSCGSSGSDGSNRGRSGGSHSNSGSDRFYYYNYQQYDYCYH